MSFLDLFGTAMLNRGLELAARPQEIHPDRFFFISPGYVLVFSVLLALSIPVSLFFDLPDAQTTKAWRSIDMR